MMPSTTVKTSDYGTFAVAVSAAASAGYPLIVDTQAVLTSNISLASNIPEVEFQGTIDFANYNLTFNGQAIRAEARRIWIYSGTGVPLGTIANDVMYPEWAGAVGWDTTAALAAAAATTAALQALENFDAQSPNGCRWLDFTGITYAVTASITNPNPGSALRWRGHGTAFTRIFNTNTGASIRLLTGATSGSALGVFCKDLGFYGRPDQTSTLACLEVRDWCGFETEGMLFDFNNTGLYLRDYAAGQYSENYRGRRNTYGSGLKSRCIVLSNDNGTGSFRGFSETEFLYSRQSGSALDFLWINSGGDFLYNGHLIGTITNHTSGHMNVVNCTNPQGARFVRSHLDLEQSAGGSITLGATGSVRYGGGFQANSPYAGIKMGTAVLGWSQILDGGIEAGLRGWNRIDNYTITGNGAPFIIAETSYFQGKRNITVRLNVGTSFSAWVDATIFLDDLGSNHQINVVSVKVPYNTLGISFGPANIGVNSAGRMTVTANFGSTVVDVSGIVEHFGGLTQ